MSADGADDREAGVLRLLLDDAAAAIRRRDFAEALRYSDAAARRATDNPEVTQLLGRMLFEVGHLDEALAVLERAAALRREPEVEAVIIDILRLQGRHNLAVARLASALRAFSIDPEDVLAGSADRLVEDLRSGVRGWFGLSPRLEIVGSARDRGLRLQQLELRVGPSFTSQLYLQDSVTERGLLRFASQPVLNVRGRADVLFRDESIAGTSLPIPPDYGLEGRCELVDGEIRGWAQMAWARAEAPPIVVMDESGARATAAVEPASASPWRHQFSLDLAWAGLKGDRLTVLGLTPSGEEIELPDSPVLARLRSPPRGARLFLAPKHRPRLWPRRRRRRVDVIIPVYRGLDETLTCIRSVLETLDGNAEVVVVDDASPEPRLSAELQSLAAAGKIVLMRNERNLGFPGSVNVGIGLHPDRDVVLLNADAEVFPEWLERLRRAAYSEEGIGTVTALTNSGSIASYPCGAGTECDSQTARQIAETAIETNAGEVVDFPTGVGFCLYMRRDCIRQTGPFDAAAFSKGYGEESDFCMRASKLGWRHVLAADVFVRHGGGRSFGRRETALRERNAKLLQARHPHYERLVKDWIARDPLKPARRRLDECRALAGLDNVVLLISLSLPGGVARVVRERAEQLRRDGHLPIVVKAGAADKGVKFDVLANPGLAELSYDLPEEADQVFAWLRRLSIGRIEFHHFLGLDSGLINSVLEMGVPYDVFVHDYSWICPRVTLIGGDGSYCGEPDLPACQKCVVAHGSRLHDSLTVRALRHRSRRWLRDARRVVAPSRDVAERIQKYFPKVVVEIDPWQPSLPRVPIAPELGRDTVKVAVIGAIGLHKGYDVLLRCAKDAAERSLPLEFVLIGFSKADRALVETGKVFVTGEYEEEELEALLLRERPAVALYASVWPETWCFALSPALSAGLPVVAFDLGAIAERLRASDSDYRLLPLGAEAGDINDALLSLGRPPIALASPPAASGPALPAAPAAAEAPSPALPSTSASPPGPSTLREARFGYAAGPEGQWPPEPSAIVPFRTAQDASATQGGLTASVEVMTLNRGLYLFSLDAASPRTVGDEGDLVLPAVHIGLAPGVSSGQVEIMTGLNDRGSWLYEERDILAVKVISGPLPILIISLRGAGMAGLELSVERIDGGKGAASARSPRRLRA